MHSAVSRRVVPMRKYWVCGPDHRDRFAARTCRESGKQHHPRVPVHPLWPQTPEQRPIPTIRGSHARALLQLCSHSRGTISDYTSTTSHSVVLDYVQFVCRTFWRVQKLTLSLTKGRAHIPSIKTAVMDLLTEWARSACRDADRSTPPSH